MPYVEATGAKLYFEETGYGYPIIFIHELASDIRGWETQLRHFSRGHRCVAYNARGYPPSDIPEDFSSYGWEFAVDDIAAVMRGLKIERAHLGRICRPAVWVAVSGKSQRDCRSKRGVWLSSLPA